MTLIFIYNNDNGDNDDGNLADDDEDDVNDNEASQGAITNRPLPPEKVILLAHQLMLILCPPLIMVFPSACFQITFQTQIKLVLNRDHWLVFLIMDFCLFPLSIHLI